MATKELCARSAIRPSLPTALATSVTTAACAPVRAVGEKCRFVQPRYVSLLLISKRGKPFLKSPRTLQNKVIPRYKRAFIIFYLKWNISPC